MSKISDQDRFFSGAMNASTPRHLIGEGEVARILNGRFIEGAITNAIGMDELPISFVGGENNRVFARAAKYDDILRFGDVQLVAPLSNVNGDFLILVISGLIFKVPVSTGIATDITPKDAYLPGGSYVSQLSYPDNDGGRLGVGGYLVIFNYPNKSIIIDQTTARLANAANYEVPPSRMGVTAGIRMFTISGSNLMYASDPLGGAQSLAPLTFEETLSGAYKGQVFTIGSALDIENVTCIARLPNFLSASQDFLASQLLVSTRKHKYIIPAAAPRDQWDQIQFINYAGSTDGIAGPLASTNIGDSLLYTNISGRIKSLSQDQERETGLTETFLDDPLGQYLCLDDPNLYYRDWYRNLDHRRVVMKFFRDRLYSTVYPIKVPAIDGYGRRVYSPTHRAMAIGSLDSTTRLGPQATIAWEGFYDWLQPIGLITLNDGFYVVSKSIYGRINVYKQNYNKLDDHDTVIYSRGYLRDSNQSRSINTGTLYFRRISGKLKVKVDYLANDKWIDGGWCDVDGNIHRYSFRKLINRSDSWSIPIRITIRHNGCRFELESSRVTGESHRVES